MKVRPSAVYSFLLLLLAAPGAPAADKVMSPTDNVRITFSRGRDVMDVKNGSIGEKLAEFKPTVKLQNDSFSNFNGNRVCLVMIGEDATTKGNFKAICRREFDASIEAGKSFEWVGDSFQQGFDHTLATSGFDYAGYIIIIKNSEGKYAVSAATKPVWIKDLDKAWGLQEGKEYSKKFFTK